MAGDKTRQKWKKCYIVILSRNNSTFKSIIYYIKKNIVWSFTIKSDPHIPTQNENNHCIIIYCSRPFGASTTLQRQNNRKVSELLSKNQTADELTDD
jgi:hypothetical protein